MKNVLLLIIMMVGSVVSSMGQTQKTLVKSIDLAQAKHVVAQLPGAIQSSTWENDFVRVTTYLTVDNMPESIVKQLVLVGRYNLATTIDENTQTLVITMPKIANHVRVKGIALNEQFRFEIQAPAGYPITIQDAESKGTAADGGQTL